MARSNARWVAALVACAGGIWALGPPWIGSVRIERTELLAPGVPDGRTEPTVAVTPIRIAVTFAAADDLTALRRRWGLDYVAVRLLDCRSSATGDQAVIIQGDGPLIDYHGVTALSPAADGRHRYRVVFDNRLSEPVDHQDRFSSALGTPGGLCLQLHSGRMWLGGAHSAPVPVPLPNR